MNIESSEIIVNNITIEIVRKKIKNLHLAVYPPDGRVRLATPEHITDEAARMFVISKLNWLRRNLVFFEAKARQTPREYITGESHYFMGNRFLLDVVYADATAQITIRNNHRLEMQVRPGADVNKRREVLAEWYRMQLKAILPELIDKWSSILKVNLVDWKVMQMKTRWGSCNTAKRQICLNLELAKKPLHCIEYIVVHELAHLKHRKHDDEFRALLSQHLPRWQELRKELNEFIV